MTLTAKQYDIIRTVQGRKTALPAGLQDLQPMAADGLIYAQQTAFRTTIWHVTKQGLTEAAAYEAGQP